MRNLSLMTDLYQLSMLGGHNRQGKNETVVFDMFFRQTGVQSNYAIAAGLEQLVEYIEGLSFDAESIRYLRDTIGYGGEFLNYLTKFKFGGDIYAVPEGTVVFPDEPIITVVAPLMEAQLIETALLNIINHQTLIATKASRIAFAASPGLAVEFGLRRAHGPDAGLYGSRAAIIGGAIGTSNVLAAKEFGVMAKGTHAHSWVMSYPSEFEAFEAYAECYPDNCLLLVDTFDTLKSGIPNAIKVFDKLKENGHKPIGIRLDSGDLAYLSKVSREMLDKAGYGDAVIMASGDIDEFVIESLKTQGARIDIYGVGTKLVTGDGISLGGVYKMSALKSGGAWVPKIKLSNSLVKTTNPGRKKLWRIYDASGKAFADLIALDGETLPVPLVLTHPVERYKNTRISEYTAKELQVPIFKAGKRVYSCPSLTDIAEYSKKDKATFWGEYFRLANPHIYKVNLSDKLHSLKNKLLETNNFGQ